jgi:threonine synthase
VIAVPEDEIAPALLRLGRLGLYVEPTSATVGAALSRLLAGGTITPAETTVAVITGHGLKAADKIGELIGSAGS